MKYETWDFSKRKNQEKAVTKMTNRELLEKIANSLVLVMLDAHGKTNEDLEAGLETIKRLWLKERPLVLHTDN